ncbi:hypothetical protein [Streptomyces sp. NPDC006527]|uniref:hypothetical protein n=1 Tax=Streptomyces sp. NPDC006527 TaxID=3364749 RepID=UPI0036B760E6
MFDSLDEELKATVHTWESRSNGWQTLQIDFGTWDDADLAALVEWSRAPACVADVSDSSLALVTGLDTTGQRWQAWLNLDIAAKFLAEEPEDLEDQILWLGERWLVHGHCKWQYGNDVFCSRRGRRKFRVRGQNYCEDHYIQVISADR